MRRLIILFILIFPILSLSAHVRIKMQKEGGVFRIPCEVNGLRLKFIFDTGASNVAISLSEAYLMLDNGYLNKEDIVGTSHSTIADGSIVENTQIILKELKIGGIILKDVEAVVIKELQAPLLLGQSAIQKLGKIQIEDDELVIMNIKSEYSQKEIDEMFELADKYHKSKMYVASAEIHQKLYDLGMLSDYGIFILGHSYLRSSNYQQAIKYLLLTESAEGIDEELKDIIYSDVALSYKYLKDYERSLLYYQKSFPYIKKDDISSLYYFFSSTSELNLKMNKCYEYKQDAELALKYLLLINKTSMSEIIRSGYAKAEIKDELYLIGGALLYNCNLTDWGKYYLSVAAHCGQEAAIRYCDSYKIDYNNIIVR